jgi:hypothetical protein
MEIEKETGFGGGIAFERPAIAHIIARAHDIGPLTLVEINRLSRE